MSLRWNGSRRGEHGFGLRTGSVLALGLFAAAVVPASVHAQSGRSQAREGNRLYQEGLFEEAHRKYLEALAENPESPLIRFNDGDALYRTEDYQSALQAYLETLEKADPSLAGPTWYNLGNTLFRQQQLEQSLEAYKEALRLNSGDQDAKHNLERVLQLMQEQQDQQDQNQNQEEQDQQNQDQQNQEQENQDQQDQSQQDQDQQNQDQPSDDEQQQEQQPEQPEPEPGDENPEDQPEAGEGQPPPAPGQMTPDEAERLLEAIQEDPGDVNRKRAPVRGPKPRKPW